MPDLKAQFISTSKTVRLDLILLTYYDSNIYKTLLTLALYYRYSY